MKRNLLLLAVMVLAVAFYTGQTWAQQDPNDLGLPDSVVVLTCPDDHTYEAAPGSFDSVRVEVYVTHDSNYVDYNGPNQDSLRAIIVPLNFWHQPCPCADSVIFPFGNPMDPNSWNNPTISDNPAKMGRSMFRHTCGKTNRLTDMVENWFAPWNVYTDFESFSCCTTETGEPGGDIYDMGHVFFSVVPMDPNCLSWYEGSQVLLATLTFHVYMSADCDTTEIGLDSTFWSPASNLTFTRLPSEVYFVQHNLPVKDTIYIVPNHRPECFCNGPDEPCSLEVHKEDALFDFHATDEDDDEMTYQLVVLDPQPFNQPVVTITTDVPGLLEGDIVWTPNCLVDKSNWYHFLLIVDDGKGGRDTCDYFVHCYNNPPWLVDPPDDSVHGNRTTYVGEFEYGDADPDDFDDLVITVSIDPLPQPPTNLPQLAYAGGTGTVTWTPTCEDICIIYTFDLIIHDQCCDAETSYWQVHVYNNPPEIAGPPSCDTIKCGKYAIFEFTATDPDDDPICSMDIWADDGYISDINPSIPPCQESGVTVQFRYYCPDECDSLVDITIYIMVDDTCGAIAEYEFVVHCEPVVEQFNQVVIPNYVYERFGYEHWVYPDSFELYQFGVYGIFVDDFCYPYYGINPGDFFEIPINLYNFETTEESGDRLSIGSFELEVEFDHVDLTFYGAYRGILLHDRYLDLDGEVTWSWEYFSYRLCPCPEPGCLKYKIRFFGQAEMPDGLLRRGYCLNPEPEFPHEYWATDVAIYPDHDTLHTFSSLVWMRFKVANNELLRDLKLPIRFEWEHKLCGEYPDYYICQDWDCHENTMGDCDGVDLYVSKEPMEYEPNVCGLSQPGGGVIYPILCFHDGGVHICSPCTSFKCVRGDINLNHIAYDPADPVLLARAIIFGAVAVFWNIDEQTCASDVNADGRPLMLADLIYLIRVIQGDAIAYPKLGPSSDIANLIVADDRVSVECASQIGGLLFVFDGAVTPTLLASDMELLANEERVLVWSRDGNSISAGVAEVLSVTGAELVSVTAVDREGRDLATTIVTKVAPSAFALHAAYPNPFNPDVNLSFSLPNAVPYSLKIYNVAGQLVRSYDGMGQAGLNVIRWNGQDNAGNDVSTGVYFFKLSAGAFNATSKMVLMK